MQVAIIGAGPAGLASARHVSSQGVQCEVFEMASEVGGTWVYSDYTDKDQYGYPVHTSMYKGLRANLPKEVMGFPDFPIPEQDESFPTQKTILDFLNLYADHFKLRELIKFNQMVTDIRPLKNDKWQIKSIHKPTSQESVNIYDFVMICNGHYHTPVVPKFPGEEKFKGNMMHSHQYRSADNYKNQRVLVVGGGYSGLDIAFQLATVAHTVVISHHPNKHAIGGAFPANVMTKPEVSRIRNHEEVEFVDGSCCPLDVIIYCTGFKYSLPFLHESCGITVSDKLIRPLYKHIVNIERPTMCFVGIPVYACAFQMTDIQARFCCQLLNGSLKLPSKELMYKDMEEDMMKRKRKGLSENQMHLLAHNQQEYYEELANIANITVIPPVITKIWSACDETFYNNLQNFRNVKYRVINNTTFTTIN